MLVSVLPLEPAHFGSDRVVQDLTRILRHYLPAWNRQKVVLVGYSMGADVLPFLISRLPADLVTCTEMSGRHRVGRNYGGITQAILDSTER